MICGVLLGCFWRRTLGPRFGGLADDEHPEVLVVPDVPQIGSTCNRVRILSKRESMVKPRTGDQGVFSSVFHEGEDGWV